MRRIVLSGRPPEQREKLVQHVRGLIVSGKLKPGARLPSHVALEQRLGISALTVQNGLNVLRADGFIESRPRLGTFVVPHPPHLSHFAVAFPFGSWAPPSQFYHALRQEAARIRMPERWISVFNEIGNHVDVDDYQRLLGFVRSSRLAGLIFAANPHLLAEANSPLLAEPGLAQLAVMLPDTAFAFPTAYPDVAAFLPMAFDYLAARGHRRVAVVTLGGPTPSNLAVVQALAATRGLTLQPHWLQAAYPDSPAWSRQAALLLLHAGQAERPDAVVITDDNLVPGYTTGIRDSGIRVVAGDGPVDLHGLEVVAQANFPYPTPSAVPAKRLGYDIQQLMAVCLERIDQQRRGEKVPAHTAIPAVFEKGGVRS